MALMGPAAEILRGFDDSADKALDDLWGRLRHRFGTVDECQQAMRDFESRRQSESESLAEFEQVLRTLHREAWPDQSDEQRDPILKRRFEKGVASAELRQSIIGILTFDRPRRKLVFSQPRWERRRRRRASGL